MSGRPIDWNLLKDSFAMFEVMGVGGQFDRLADFDFDLLQCIQRGRPSSFGLHQQVKDVQQRHLRNEAAGQSWLLLISSLG